jgi:isopentenyl phosphate kinase
MLRNLLFVKLGGSILTDKTRPESINNSTLQTTASAIAAFLQVHPRQSLLIGHGGGSFGHYWAERYATHRGVFDASGWQGFARVADAMGRLNRYVVQALLADGGVLQQLDVTTIQRLLAVGLIPVVHGDVVLDQRQGAAIASTEHIFAYLAPRLTPRRIVLVGEQGVFTADPRRDPTASRITRITTANIETVLTQTGASHGTDVTGGMATKVREMWQLVQLVPGLEVQLVGTDGDVIGQALRGNNVDEGTIIRA